MAAQHVTAEIHGFSQPDSVPTPWEAGLERLRKADTCWLSTVRPDGRPHVTPLIAVWHADALWFRDFVVRDGAFSDRQAGGRVLVFRLRPVRGLGFRKGDRFSQTTWQGF